jgi:hypothetical protein
MMFKIELQYSQSWIFSKDWISISNESPSSKLTRTHLEIQHFFLLIHLINAVPRRVNFLILPFHQQGRRVKTRIR